jgi:rhomboid family GlyGly-CTERM serine protease
MDSPNPQNLSSRVPLLTLLMVGGALAVEAFPQSSAWLIYDRPAILSGQLWRMFTGHWVHFSTGHRVCDLIPLGVAGWILEARGCPRFGWFCALTPWVISAAALIFQPDLISCGGLSGLDSALVTWLALEGLSDAPPWRWVCVSALLGMAGKIVVESATGHSLFVTVNGNSVLVSVTHHVAGAATALIFYGLSKLAPPRSCSNFPTAQGQFPISCPRA